MRIAADAKEKSAMKPRIFVSSTFYDLKYIREDLSNFIRTHGFDPILFEDGDIGYTPGRHLDDSCYESLKQSDMVLLVIGGNYGSPASSEKKDEFKEYLSVTRKEFGTAVGEGIPVFVFIDNKVYTEYGIYEANQEEIESGASSIRFSVTKDINVFRFIREIKGIDTLSITEFIRVSDIKEFLEKQWSDMFKNYLEALKGERRIKNLEDTVRNMERLMKKMDMMLDVVGKKVLESEEVNTYQSVLDNQKIILASEKITDYIQLGEKYTGKKREKQIKALLHIYKTIEGTEMQEKAMSKNRGDYMKFFDYCETQGAELEEYSDLAFSEYEEILAVLDSGKTEKAFLECLLSEQYYDKFFDAAVD